MASINGTLTIFVEGTDSGMYHTTVNPTTNAAGSWSADGGVLQHGAGATALS